MSLWGYSKWKYFLPKPRSMVKNINELRTVWRILVVKQQSIY